MSGSTHTDTTTVDVDVETESYSLVGAVLENWVLYVTGLIMAALAIIGSRYKLTAGPTDEILFTFLAVVLIVAAIARTLHLLRGG